MFVPAEQAPVEPAEAVGQDTEIEKLSVRNFPQTISEKYSEAEIKRETNLCSQICNSVSNLYQKLLVPLVISHMHSNTAGKMGEFVLVGIC